MNKANQEEFKKLIKEGSLEALKSEEGKQAIVGALSSDSGREAIVGALSSDSGREAIVGALSSKEGQSAIKKGALLALKSEEGEEIFSDYFIEAFNQVVVPVFEKHEERIENLEGRHLRN